MYIKNLKIYNNNSIIRNINFKIGFNFIVDETSSNLQETGNNVGKTTVLKLIDYCLGGKVDEIYTDPENKNQKYNEIKNYLEEKDIFVSLSLTNDLEKNDKTILIERNFLVGKNKLLKINKNIFNKDKEFQMYLRKLIFPNLKSEKPTFRQIISQNIRYNEKRVNNTLKFLNNYASDLEYETLFLFLLGCDIKKLKNKENLNVKLRDEINFKKKLEKNETKFSYQIALEQIKNEILKLENQKNKLNLNINFNQDLEILNKIKYEISKISKTITNQELRKAIIINSIQDLEKEIVTIDLKMLKNIYGQALEYIEKIHKKFDELLNFHNKMIQEKSNFIAKELPKIRTSINENKNILNSLLEKEILLTEKLKKGDPFKEDKKIIELINNKYEKKGEYESIISQIFEVEKKIETYELELKEIEESTINDKYKKIIESQIRKFNEYFSMVSEKLYGEKYLLTYNEKKHGKTQQKYYDFWITNLNLSSGKKQGEILCYDIAYILFAMEEKIDCIHFLLNDKKEIMHINQLEQLVIFLKDKNIQLIIPILRDKLTEELTRENNIILKLSQKDKLFKI